MDVSSLLLLAVAVVAAGSVAGFVAGLFGIGGGIVIVPALYYAFGAVGVDDATRMHAAVATSLATIVVTSWRSARAHHARGAVDWEVVRAWTPWIVVGALAGSVVARFIPGAALTLAFGVGAMAMAARMGLFGEAGNTGGSLPRGALRAGLGSGLGLASSWMGIGGGVLGVTMLTLGGRPIHQAVGTAAVFGAAIGLPAALGFALSGLGVEGRAPLSIGYVNAPAFLAIIAATTVTAPWGARAAHALSPQRLRVAFATGLAVLGLNMAVEGVRAFL